MLETIHTFVLINLNHFVIRLSYGHYENRLIDGQLRKSALQYDRVGKIDVRVMLQLGPVHSALEKIVSKMKQFLESNRTYRYIVILALTWLGLLITLLCMQTATNVLSTNCLAATDVTLWN